MHGWERESMALPDSSSYHPHWDCKTIGSESGSVSVPHTGVQSTYSFSSLINPNISFQSPVRDTPLGSSFSPGNSPPIFSHSPPNPDRAGVPANVANGESGKRKRGRPRKYAPNGAGVSLKPSPMSGTPPAGSIMPIPKKKGRPRGSGWKQQLAPLGEWMNRSAGLAFTPHVINIAIGEDILAKIVLFFQQRPRALCILSASGLVSSVTLQQTGLGSKATYEGCYEILCLSGSYLVHENGDRTGGLSVSLSGPDGIVIGGGVGVLIAASPVQVVVGSFVYGFKSKDKVGSAPKQNTEKLKSGEKLALKVSGDDASSDNPNVDQISAPIPWPSSSASAMKNPKSEIEPTWGYDI